MLGSSNVSGFRKRVAGISLVGFVTALVAQDIVDPHAKDDPASMYDALAAHADALLASNLLLLASAILLVPAVFGIIHLVRGRGRHLAHAGAALGVLGALGHAGLAASGLIFLELPRVGDRAAMLTLLDRLNTSAVLVVFSPLLISFGFGMLLLTLALWRARVVPVWIPAAFFGALALHFVAPEDLVATRAAESVLAAISFGYIGFRVLRMSNAEWGHPRDFTRRAPDQPAGSDATAPQNPAVDTPAPAQGATSSGPSLLG